MPRLLAVMADSPAARAEFERGWGAVPRGAWLAWAPSMLSLLDTDVGETLLPLLEVSMHQHPRVLTTITRA